MVEETYEALDLLLFSTDQQTLRDFSSHIGLDTAQTDNLNKRKLLKEIRDFVGASLDQNTEAENVKNFNEWLGFFKRGDDHEDEDDHKVKTEVMICRMEVVVEERDLGLMIFCGPE